MNNDQLKDLLRGAEADFERPDVAPAELVERVRGLDRRRRQRARVVLTLAPLAVVGVVLAGWSLWPDTVPTKSEQRVAHALPDVGEIERLRTEAEFHERVARQMIASHQRDRAREAAKRALLQSDPLQGVREQIDVVAYRMVERADALRTQMDPPAEAIRVYFDVQRMFPTTYSAELARKRLSELGLSEGET